MKIMYNNSLSKIHIIYQLTVITIKSGNADYGTTNNTITAAIIIEKNLIFGKSTVSDHQFF